MSNKEAIKIKHLIITSLLGDTTMFSSKLTAEDLYPNGAYKEPMIRLFAHRGDASWTQLVSGKQLAYLKDHGNGVQVKFRESGVINLDYGQLQELELLLAEYRADVARYQPKVKRVQLS